MDMDQRQRLKRKRMIRQKKMTGKVEYSYFDYGLVAVLIFLLCFGLIMLYSTSYYSAQIDYDSVIPLYRKDQQDSLRFLENALGGEKA